MSENARVDEALASLLGKAGYGGHQDPNAGNKLAKAAMDLKAARSASADSLAKAKAAADALERNIRVLDRVRSAVCDESKSRSSIAEMIDALVDRAKVDVLVIRT